MEIKNIVSNLEIVGLIVREWEGADKIDSVERTLVLKKLRDSLDAVEALGAPQRRKGKAADISVPSLFSQAESQPESFAEPAAESVAPAQSVEPAQPEPSVQEPDLPEPAPEPEIIPDPEPEPEMTVIEPVEADDEADTDFDLQGMEVASEPIENQMDDVPEPDFIPSDASEPASEVSAADEMTAVPSVSRRVLDYLYGDDEAESPVQPVQAAPEHHEPIPEPIPEPSEQPHVIGEVLNHGVQVLGDTVRASEGHTIGEGTVASIGRSMGLNDRFMVAKELFGGDMEAMSRAVAALDSFEYIDDAILYVYDCGWDTSKESTKLLMDLVSRKLS